MFEELDKSIREAAGTKQTTLHAQQQRAVLQKEVDKMEKGRQEAHKRLQELQRCEDLMPEGCSVWENKKSNHK